MQASGKRIRFFDSLLWCDFFQISGNVLLFRLAHDVLDGRFLVNLDTDNDLGATYLAKQAATLVYASKGGQCGRAWGRGTSGECLRPGSPCCACPAGSKLVHQGPAMSSSPSGSAPVGACIACKFVHSAKVGAATSYSSCAKSVRPSGSGLGALLLCKVTRRISTERAAAACIDIKEDVGTVSSLGVEPRQCPNTLTVSQQTVS